MSVEEKIHYQILHRRKEGIEALLDEALRSHTPVEVLNDVLLPAMKDVGDRFGAGELILPFVLQSAEVMKRAVAHLEQFLDKQEGYAKGKVVIATVFGDVHDIGKNLVGTILSNNGYTVYDLGKQTPINVIIDRAVEVGADAIGLSALLVSTSKQMPLCVQELAKRGLEIPVLIGGAAINRHFGRRSGILESAKRLRARRLLLPRRLRGPRRDGRARRSRAPECARREGPRRGARRGDGPGRLRRRASARPAPTVARSKVSTTVPVPRPPFWGARTISDVPLAEVFDLLDLKTLFRLHWGGKGVRGDDWDALIERDFGPRLERMKAAASEYSRASGRLRLLPGPVVGRRPPRLRPGGAIQAPPSLPLPAPARPGPPLPRRLLPTGRVGRDGRRRLPGRDRRRRGGARIAELNARGEVTEAYFVHGLSVQSAEALAEWAHARVRRELGLAPDQGRRYSWGYPACPDLEQHAQVFDLLDVTRAIGLTLTPAYQLVPEQSTAAMVVHHPEAIYYSTREVVG